MKSQKSSDRSISLSPRPTSRGPENIDWIPGQARDDGVNRVVSEAKQYLKDSLDLQDLLSDPVKQFCVWFEEVIAHGIDLPDAMVLATSDLSGMPDARVVLLKQYDSRGFVFFTHATSAKGQQLKKHPQAAIVFFWPSLERQVRIKGHVQQTSNEEADLYFASRPRGSQLGAWISKQSSKIASRQELEILYSHLEEQYEGREIPRPPQWVGYRLEPTSFEFWQGRDNRLHDRFVYEKSQDGWTIKRLAP